MMDAFTGVVPLASVDFWMIVKQTDTFGWAICLLLIGGSVWVWTMMVNKYYALKKAERDCWVFLKVYRQQSHPMLAYFEGDADMDCGGQLLSAVYRQSGAALEAVFDVQGVVDEGQLKSAHGLSAIRLSDRQIHSVQNAAERSVADQALMLEKDMAHLASASSLAPFMGLFGTVWGVMMSFGNMAGSGTALLSEVAPGISSALLTTFVGLFVALPSSFGYNLLLDRIRRLTVLMDNFAQEMTGDLERVHLA